MKSLFFGDGWSIALYCLPCLCLAQQSELKLPADEDEIEAMFQSLTDGKVDIANIQGVYPLPETFNMDGREIAFVSIAGGIVALREKGEKAQEYLFVKPPASIELLLNSKKLSDVADAIPTIDGRSFLTLIPASTFPELAVPSTSAFEFPLRVCYFQRRAIYFFSAVYPLKMTSQPVLLAEKPIGDLGPLRFSLKAVQVLFQEKL